MKEPSVTGERVIEDAYQASAQGLAIYLAHLASYRFATQFTQDKRVLDIGCGTGYGAEFIARTARDVVAVDVSAEAVEYAAERHGRENLSHQVINPGDDLPFPDGSFDVVLSFQVIEHVERDRHYIAQAGRVLAGGGVLIVITPNRDVRLLPGQKPWNRWHLREYDAAGLMSLFNVDEFTLEMKFLSASPRIVALEMRRYRRLKWLTLPVTLPFLPEAWRVRGLNLLHAIAPSGSTQAPMPAPPFEESEIFIGERSGEALDLVAVAIKHAAVNNASAW